MRNRKRGEERDMTTDLNKNYYKVLPTLVVLLNLASMAFVRTYSAVRDYRATGIQGLIIM